jgi:hypothetical protein
MRDDTFSKKRQDELDDIIIDLINDVKDDSPDKSDFEHIYENDDYLHDCVRLFELDTDEFTYVRSSFNERIKLIINDLR